MPHPPGTLTARWPASVLIFVLVAGCGPDRPRTHKVSGTVTLDGNPIAGASVMFIPESGGRPATGVTDEEGEFTLSTFESGDGALPGKHAVTVTLKEVSGMIADKDGLSAGVGPNGLQVRWIIPERYSTPETSKTTVEVARGMDAVKLELTTQ